jgi:NADH dehydrogenase FAD-containing subunit
MLFEAYCSSINLKDKELECESTLGHENERANFSLSYDKLVIAVGAWSNTFNMMRVKQHVCFLKDVSDARKIRARLQECMKSHDYYFY